MADLLRSPIHDVHVGLGAQLVPFAGYEMPVRYSSIQEEHVAVRTAAGLFDVSHMSNLWLRGPEAAKALARTTVADATAIKTWGTKYTALLREDGTIIDDAYIFHFPDGHMLVPNAGMNRPVASWITEKTKHEVEDVTATTCIFALQGPKAAQILQSVIDIDLRDVKPFRCAYGSLGDYPSIPLSRTGYTGEDGFELFPNAGIGREIFQILLKAGQPHGLKPCGLGARDTLRLEKGYCLAGHEFEGGRTPLEAGLDRFVHWGHDFVGKAALEAQRARGTHPRLVGLQVEDKGIPRQGCEVRPRGQAARAGVVTSGTLSPTLKHGIALAYVDPPSAKIATKVDIIIRGQASPATVVELPFLK